MHQERGRHGLDPRVAEAQGGHPAVVDDGGTVQRVEGLHADRAVMADALDVEKTPVGLEADLPEVIEVAQPAPDAEVVRVADHRLAPQRAALLEVPLDARALAGHVRRRQDAVGDDAGSEPRAGPARDAAAEDRLHVVGASDVEVLADGLLERDPAADRAVEHLREGALRLEDREVVADPLRAILRREGMGKPRRPLAEQRVDRPGAGLPGDALHGRGIGAARDPAVEGLERDRALLHLPLQALVPVDAELCVVRKTRAELDEAGTEVVADQVDVEGIDRRRVVDKFRGGPAGGRIDAFPRAQDARLLLGLADVEHAFAVRPAAEISLRDVVLAHPLPEGDDIDAPVPGEPFQALREPPGHGRHQGPRRARGCRGPPGRTRRRRAGLQQRGRSR